METYVGYWNYVRKHKSGHRLLHAIAARDRCFLEVISVFGIVNVVDKVAVQCAHPLEKLICIGLAFFP